jgi:hypothetical protein
MGMKRFRFLLRMVAAWGLILLAVVNIVNYAQATKVVWDSFFNYFESVDDVTRWENRLAELKSQIPPNVDTVGYLSADPQSIEFYLTQYTIIPMVLQHGTVPDWIIANYPGKTIQIVLQKQLDTEKYAIENFGHGLYLVHKR